MAQWKDLVGGPIWWRNKSKMADGRHLGFRFWAIISASINIFAPNLVQWWKLGSTRGPNAQKSDFRKSMMVDGRHLGFRFWARDLVFSLLDPLLEVVYSRWWMTPNRGRGQGHVTYFWSNGTDTRVPQNVFLVYYYSNVMIRALDIGRVLTSGRNAFTYDPVPASYLTSRPNFLHSWPIPIGLRLITQTLTYLPVSRLVSSLVIAARCFACNAFFCFTAAVSHRSATLYRTTGV